MLKWDDLFLNGSVINLNVSVWRARLQLKLEDLGLDKNADVAKALSLGCHRLAPHEAFDNVWKPAREAQAVVEANALAFPLLEGARFVPTARIATLRAKLEDCRNRFNLAVDEFLDNYDKIQAEMLPVIEKALLEAAKDEETARRAFNRVCNEYPSRTTIRTKFGLGWKMFALTGISDAVAGAAEEESKGVKDVLSTMMGGLREDLATRLTEVMEIASKGGKLNRRTIDLTWELCDRVDNLNFVGDEILTEQVKSLRNLLGTLDKALITGDDIAGFQQIKQIVEADIADAVAQAEYKLTALGRRRLES